MKVSYNWLKEYVNFSAKPKDLADKLTMAGLEVKGIDEKNGDFIYEMEVTSNRPDWLCLSGIAREIQALYGLKIKSVKAGLLKPAKLALSFAKDLAKPPIIIEDKKGCLRYVGILIDGVQTAVSSKDLVQKIENAGVRQVNDIVDITNFCMIESGQPLHAFDYDKLEGGKVIIRRARKGEGITTIDGIKRQLDEDILVIADAKRPVAIAGIMGGRDTEVGLSTKKILIESAYFDPVLIRRGARKLGISTEASYRFERNVDLGGCLAAAQRATSLICESAKAKSISKPSDVGIKKPKDVKITLRISKANRILGTAIPVSKCASILKGLGLKVNTKGRDALMVSVPSFRRDLKEEVDLIEEISRVYGFERIPETLSRIQLWGKGTQKSRDRIIEDAVGETLTGEGLNEVITYALRRKDPYIQQALSIADSQALKVQNPLSSESEALRPVMMCGMLDVVAYNLNRKVSDIKIFELGKSYFYKGDGTPSERGVLAIALCGMKEKDWHRKEAVDVFDLKGIIEELFSKLGITGHEFEVKPLPLFSPAASAIVKINGKEMGALGKVDRALLDRYDIKGSVFVSELALEPIYSRAKLERRFSELPRYPSSARDISLIVEDKISNKDITGMIKETCGELAVTVSPFDLYRGEQVPKGCKSILYSVEYRAPDRTLTDEEVGSLDRKVREVLVQKFNAKIR